jgi:hypothetical protein
MSRADVVVPGDLEWLAAALGSWRGSRRLALRGAALSPDVLLGDVLGEAVAVQQVAWAAGGRPAALFQVTDVDDRNGVARLDVLADPARLDAVRGDAAGFLAEVFGAGPLGALRKLVLWAAEDELDVPACLGPPAQYVGRLTDHERRGPTGHADMLVYEIWKERVA